ncbi:hypothetical protein ACET3Z_032971 [Daucus carota]
MQSALSYLSLGHGIHQNGQLRSLMKKNRKKTVAFSCQSKYSAPLKPKTLREVSEGVRSYKVSQSGGAQLLDTIEA